MDIFRWLFRRATASSRAPIATLAPPVVREEEFFATAASEAVRSLGLLRDEAVLVIATLLETGSGVHPRTITTAYRKQGEQLAADEKRALGLRTNAFLSRAAYDQLTQRGLAEPLAAHELTLLRATFTMLRWHRARQARALNISAYRGEIKYASLTLDCPACEALDGVVAPVSDAEILPNPTHSCNTANYTFSSHIDWLADID
jgi:hypothetical protein